MAPPGEAPGRAYHQAQLLAQAARHVPAAAAEAWNQLLTWCWELLLKLLDSAEDCCLSLPLYLAVCCLSAYLLPWSLLLRCRWVFRHSSSAALLLVFCFLFSSGQHQHSSLLCCSCRVSRLPSRPSTRPPTWLLGPEPRARETRDNWQEAAQRPHISRVCSVCCPDARSLYNCTAVPLYNCTHTVM